MNTRLPDRLELRQRQYLPSRSQRVAIVLMVALLVLALAAGLALAFYLATRSGHEPAAMLEQMLKGILARLTSKPWDTAFHLLLLIAVVLQVVYLRRAQRLERLILTSAGIEYRTPLPAALHSLRPGWSLAWGQIRGVSFKNTLGAHGPQTVALELDAGSRKVKIYPWRWVDPQHYQPVSPWQDLRKLQRATPEAISAVIHDSAVVRYLVAAQPHLAPATGAGFVGASFALEKNPRTRALVVALLALGLYALVDTAVGHETYAGPVPYREFVAVGVFAACAAALWMWRGRVPLAETLIVALLFGGTLGAAGYPGTLRANALTDADGLRSYEYRLTREGGLEPLTPGLPTLAFPEYYEYWEQFEPGSQHAFELRKGGLGFYQLNLQPVHTALRDFYTTRNDASRRNRGNP